MHGSEVCLMSHVGEMLYDYHEKFYLWYENFVRPICWLLQERKCYYQVLKQPMDKAVHFERGDTVYVDKVGLCWWGSRADVFSYNWLEYHIHWYTMWVASPRGFSEMTIQPARHKCHACCPLQAEKTGIQPVVGNTHGTHVEQVVSSL